MNRLEFFSKNVFFTTREYAFTLDYSCETASRQLKALAEEQSLQTVTRGVWTQTHHPYYSPYGATPYLLGNEQGYISFLTALHRLGVVSQIPKTIQIATTGRGRTLSSSIGDFEFFHIQPQLFRDGIQSNEGRLVYNIASPEKALIDTVYLSTRKGRRFLKLPEIEQDAIDVQEIKRITSQLPTYVQKLVLPILRRLVSI